MTQMPTRSHLSGAPNNAQFNAAIGQLYDHMAARLGNAADVSSGTFYKTDNQSVAFSKTSSSTLSLKAGTWIDVAGQMLYFATATNVTMPALSAGTDYAIWCTPAGVLQAVADPFNAPASAPVAGSIKIGGFHFGLTAPDTTVSGGGFSSAGSVTTGGMVWTQAQVDDIAGINKYSIWDLKWRSAGEQHGFAFDPMPRTWVAIYFSGTNHIANGISRYNTDVASGSVLPRVPLEFGGNGTLAYPAMTWWASNEMALSHRARLLTEAEFVSATFGVTENQSLGGAASTIPSTTRQAGYTSRIGLEQATGHIWTWGADSSTRWDGAGGFNWRNVNGGRGQMYIGGDVNMVRVLLGGYRGSAAFSGSRASDWGSYPWNAYWSIGLRAACDHLQLV